MRTMYVCLCRKSEAHNRAVVLEMIGDLPEAESKPPSNMLFICKLNQVTTEEVRGVVNKGRGAPMSWCNFQLLL